MREITGDLWSWHAAGAVAVITTSGALDRQHRAVLPRGCARQAKDRFPDLARMLGGLIEQHGNHVYDLGQRLVNFPIENSPYEVPDLRLIEQSCRELVRLADERGWSEIVVPRPGCGGGGLSWADVKPILKRHFDDRFKVITSA